MSSKNKYSVRKITVVFTSLLMGVTASSYGTIFAQETNSKSTVEMKNDIQGRHIKNPVIEDSNTQKSGKSNNFNEVSLETDGVSTETSRESEGDKLEVDDIFEEIVKEKIDWNLVDGKAFVDNLLSKVDVDDKRQEIKKLWLAKINELLKIHINNENLLHIKNILLEGISEDDKKDGESSNNKTVESENKDTAREESSENKKADKEDQEKDKKETPEEKVSEDKKESKDNKAVESENKDIAREESPENKKADKEDQEKDKKETPGGKISEDKKESEKESDRKEPEKESNKKEESTEKKDEDVVNNTVAANKVLPAKLLGRDVTVSFNKDKIDADEVFVGAIRDETLNNEIIKKLGNDYKIIEVFEIHFKKAGEKVDSEGERTVKVSVMKKDNTELEVYHIADNNVLTKIKDVSFSPGLLQFKINHFSKFAILERVRVGEKDLESRVQIVVPAELDKKEDTKNSSNNFDLGNQNSDKKVGNNKKETEELPKTGLESEQTIVIALLALIAAIVIRKKQE